MNVRSNQASYRWAVLCALFVIAVCTNRAMAQGYPNTITFQNHSGSDAVVKLIGPVRWTVPVPNGTERAVNVPAGNYYILTRYCGGFGHCTYTKGDPFTVIQTETQYSEILITLHKVPNGNYHTQPTSAAEFNGN